MAAFSSFEQHLDASSLSVFLPNNSSPSSSPSSPINKMCALFHDPNNALSQFYQHNLHHGTTPSSPSPSPSPSPLSSNHNKKTNDSSVLNATNKNSMDSSLSVVTHKYHQTNQKNLVPFSKKRKSKEGSCPNSAQSKDMREGKGKKQKKITKTGEDEARRDVIHVRARRGQATDSHSLAERVRRERISERMKLLQALVPGCDKVTGKALMLDEIINYVQSLQNQVEFLSMKLASVNPIFYDFGMDLETFMVRPDQNLNSLASPLPAGMQECSPTANTYHALDNSVNSLLLHQSQMPNALPQGDRQVLWEVDTEQRQKIINQSGINNNLFSFPLM